MKPEAAYLFWVLVLLADTALIAYVYFQLRTLRHAHPSVPFQLSIKDLLVATIALSPALMLFAILHRASPSLQPFAPMAPALFLPYQLANIFLVLRRETAIKGDHSPFDIVIGASVGLILPAPMLCAMGVFAFALAVAIQALPYSLVFIFPLLIYLKRKFEKKRRPDSVSFDELKL